MRFVPIKLLKNGMKVGMVIENNNTLCLKPTIKIKDKIVNLFESQQYRSVTILGLLDTP